METTLHSRSIADLERATYEANHALDEAQASYSHAMDAKILALAQLIAVEEDVRDAAACDWTKLDAMLSELEACRVGTIPPAFISKYLAIQQFVAARRVKIDITNLGDRLSAARKQREMAAANLDQASFQLDEAKRKFREAKQALEEARIAHANHD